jgi:hypothetical protein
MSYFNKKQTKDKKQTMGKGNNLISKVISLLHPNAQF